MMIMIRPTENGAVGISCALQNCPGSPPLLILHHPPSDTHTERRTGRHGEMSYFIFFERPYIDLSIRSTGQRQGRRLETRPSRCRLIVSCQKRRNSQHASNDILAYEHSDENYLQDENSTAYISCNNVQISQLITLYR